MIDNELYEIESAWNSLTDVQKRDALDLAGFSNLINNVDAFTKKISLNAVGINIRCEECCL
jgi:hypothetical protein